MIREPKRQCDKCGKTCGELMDDKDCYRQHVVFSSDENIDCAMWIEWEGVPTFENDGDYCRDCLRELVQIVFGAKEKASDNP